MALKAIFSCCAMLCYFALGKQDLSMHPGHLKPLGSHGKILDVESMDYFPEPSFFFEHYVSGSKPLVIRGGAKISPAYTLWTDEYLMTFESGKKEIVIVEQAKKENRTLLSEEIPFTDFVQRYKKEDIYLVNALPEFLSKDVFLPPPLLCADVIYHLIDKLMWFSNGGTKSVLHYDSVENINCLFAGSKKLYLIDPNKYSDKVTIENRKSAYSNVDVERVDLNKYPGLADVEYYYVEMQPGDCLYIPYNWFHHVSSVGRNLAVNVWWSVLAKPLDCQHSNTTLEKFTFIGFHNMLTREMLDGVKVMIRTGFDMYENKLDLEIFRQYITSQSEYFEEGAVWSDDMMKIVEEIFSFLDEPSNDGVITPEDVASISEQTWDEVVALVKDLSMLVDEQFEHDGENDYEIDEDNVKDKKDMKDEL